MQAFLKPPEGCTQISQGLSKVIYSFYADSEQLFYTSVLQAGLRSLLKWLLEVNKTW
jgi:hypothetical protein